MFIYKILCNFYKSARKKSLPHFFDIHSRLLSTYNVSPKALTGTVTQKDTQGIPCYVLCDGHCTPPPLAETGWTGGLLAKTSILIWQN